MLQVLQLHFQRKQTLQQSMQIFQKNSKCIRSNHRSVIPTDTQTLTALQKLISDDFQAKITHSTQRKGEETPDTRSELQDETFQLIQKIHNQLQEVQWDLQRLHSLHKYKN